MLDSPTSNLLPVPTGPVLGDQPPNLKVLVCVLISGTPGGELGEPIATGTGVAQSVEDTRARSSAVSSPVPYSPCPAAKPQLRGLHRS